MDVFKKQKVRLAVVPGLFLASFAVAWWVDSTMVRSLWPAVVAVSSILVLRNAAFGLGCGLVAGAIVITGGDVVAAPRVLLADHVFPALQGPWRVGALVFTLLLGAFAGLLEHSGGFATLMHRLMSGSRDAGRRVLGGTYVVGLLCFFDGLASSLLAGRIARPLADRAGVSRERLAWVVDSTASPVACVAFISTWIATQLSLIDQGLQGAGFAADPYTMFFKSVPANAYCLLTLLLVPLAIWTGYQPRAMRRFQPVAPEDESDSTTVLPPLRVLWVPLAALAIGIVVGFPLMTADAVDVLTAAGWRASFSGSGGPYALVFGSICGLLAAWWMLPRARRSGAAAAAANGAGALLPALMVLVLAWALGGQFKALGAADAIADLLGRGVSPAWMPLAVFAVGSLMSFATGTSWGTMGLLMPLALPATLLAAANAGWGPGETHAVAAMVIGAVFGGATLGDHCSPFSDTTIVSALASGCGTMDHVRSQLPCVAIVASFAVAAYALMAAGAPPWSATAAMAACMAAWVLWKSRARNSVDRRA
jgi:Na+/H+ antiporter NhaC